jgi:hypothetical protein
MRRYATIDLIHWRWEAAWTVSGLSAFDDMPVSQSTRLSAASVNGPRTGRRRASRLPSGWTRLAEPTSGRRPDQTAIPMDHLSASCGRWTSMPVRGRQFLPNP